MKKYFLLVVSLLVWCFDTFAVLNEQNLGQTVSVLKAELERTQKAEAQWKAKYDSTNQEQHHKLLETIQESEKISLMLYSQKEDYIFDMAYACHEATRQYREFKTKRMPYDVLIKRLENEIQRYTLLIETLNSIPPVNRGRNLDSLRASRQREENLRKAMEMANANLEREKYGRVQEDTTSSGVGISVFGKQLGGDSTTVMTAEESLKKIAAERDSLTLQKARELTKDVLPDTSASSGAGVDSKLSDGVAAPPSLPRTARRFNMAAMKEFMLSEESRAERDSCVALAKLILADYIQARDFIIRDNKLYERIDQKLKSVNDYALERYEAIQHNIFTNGGVNYTSVLANFSDNLNSAVADFSEKYIDDSMNDVASDWKGPTILGLILFILGFFLVSALVSNFAIKLYSRKRELKKKFIPYYAITVTCILFTILLSLTKVVVSQNFFTMACSRLIEYVLLIAAITLSLVYRTNGGQIKSAFSCYFPVLLMGFVIIVFRIMFVPNNVVLIFFPVILVFFTIWGVRSVRKHHLNIPRQDEIYAWISLFIMTVACVMAWCGYSLFAVEVFIWWLVQLTCIQALTFLYELMKSFESSYVVPRILEKEGVKKEDTEEYRGVLKKRIREVQQGEGDNFTHTWFFDLVMKCVIPVCAVLSFLLCIYIATDIFDLTAICKDIFFTNFLDIDGLCQLSLFKLVIVLEFWFVFRFIAYVLRSVYKHWKLKRGKPHEEESANITLANNVIAILVWGIYFIFVLFLLQVPKSGISIVTAGLATGLGFAMRDMINNFFYGITLMTGRVRVGDFIECDGVRGKVESITYQSTQLITLDGCVIAFLNSSLFTKTFKNLTRNHGYELVKIPVGVAYGTDVERVREILGESLQALRLESTGGKANIDQGRQISVYFSDFGESSVDLYVVMWVLVENKFVIVSRAKEIIYNTLNANNIEIPFPQRDLHIIK